MNCDFLIVGAGIAGASAAYELSKRGKTVLLEQESRPGYHTTGRSAAFFTLNYGNRVIRALTLASRDFLFTPPEGFTEHPLVTPRGVLVIARDDQRANFERNLEEARKLEPAIHQVSVDEAIAMLPVLRRDYVAAAHFEPGSMYMDVDLIHGGFLRGFRQTGGHLACDAEARDISRADGLWTIDTPAGRYRAPVLINAAGAWADTIARRAGLAPIGLRPKRRTVIIFDDPEAPPIDASPMAIDVDEEFYFKPEAGKILASPADETPSEPCDARPEEIDIALAVDRIERATTLKARRIEHKWAGLRSFVADRSPVAGFAGGIDDSAGGFLWLAGQGGYGIMTSPAMGRVAATLAAGEDWPEDLSALGVTAADLSPSRLKRDHG